MTELDEKEKLTPVQMQAVGLLAFGESITSVAEKLNVSRQTVSTWLNKDTSFHEALWFRQSELWNSELRRVRAMTSKALDVLFEALESDDYKIRLAAAKTLVSTLGLPALVAESFKPLRKEFWRTLSETEKKDRARLYGMEENELSTVMVKIS